MAHIAVVSAPYSGHLNPSLSLAAQLVRRGHEVTFPAPERFTDQVRRAGADPVEYRSPLAEMALEHHDDLSIMMPCLLGEAKAVHAALRGHLADRLPDCVLFDVLAWGGLMFAAEHGITEVQTSPIFASNEVFSLESRYGTAAGDPAALQTFHDDLMSFVTGLGIPDVVRGMFEGVERNIVFIPREFQYSGETFDDRHVFVGPCFLDEPDTFEVRDTRAPVIVSMGTTHTRGTEFFRRCLSAAAILPSSVVIITGDGVDRGELGEIPRDVEVHTRVPSQRAALAGARAFVMHGGMNSVMEALDQRVPMVVIPQRPEQAANADRIVELGLGVKLGTSCTADELARAVQSVCADPGIHARLGRMHRALRAAGGPDRAARQVEAWLKA
ncbi:macrolide family glycosyltransferase [Kibdelosporangium persicum]|uniref:Demethyllactenocin mycarosyltransferase n=1 Tax=Kibdelosporangium persicum TaxID=2698649 RepID=A0ABX2FJA2_9PSEU|nr:macrolide family glycosyltransferase [Kibdelosporangium persicum]NRN70952.1 Demethyllactenocin mycarosyltransferase [Kibdelosporangium persicum]